MPIPQDECNYLWITIIYEKQTNKQNNQTTEAKHGGTHIAFWKTEAERLQLQGQPGQLGNLRRLRLKI